MDAILGSRGSAQLDTTFSGPHNSASSLLRLRRNKFADEKRPDSTLFNNETADKCGRLVKGATGTEGRRGLTPGHKPTAPAELKTSSAHAMERGKGCNHFGGNITYLDSSE
jgi:hypothetical protein